ncbi:hypothetical protein FZ934_07875 [Rhizobium grahamii]|uniref:Uncharacterized protein n=1 Tax=Rhizobium grahamii TaxID=1120045 RepID=A0A5Q0C8T3_9HYPH|nr:MULTISPECIES: hypothetical protein [Rhizobium]QFY60357.1 hypothetical protein FZ934_07875 [Rhizobium grahamii]QRM50517.1 hypothetical protein F3Y33_15015 [Rhizobium sp. BG6]
MNGQAAKNIRQAFPGLAFGSPDYEASQAAARWATEPAAAAGSRFLASLGLLEIAQRCLVDGETLEAAGEAGPYGTCSQQRAWAAGRLAAACHAMVLAEELAAEKKAASDRIAELEQALAYARAETRAAARFHTINVPFREKRKRSVDWGAA